MLHPGKFKKRYYIFYITILLLQFEKSFPFREILFLCILIASVIPHANKHTSMDHDPVLRGKCCMSVSHICDIVIDTLYADHPVIVSCAIFPSTNQNNWFLTEVLIMTSYH